MGLPGHGFFQAVFVSESQSVAPRVPIERSNRAVSTVSHAGSLLSAMWLWRESLSCYRINCLCPQHRGIVLEGKVGGVGY